MANLIFGGHKIGSSVLQFSAARGITSEIENTSHSVGISDGEMLINSRLKSRIIPVTYDFVALSRREFERQLAPLLYSTDVQKLIIDDRPDEFWYAKVDGKIDMDRAYFLGTGTINFLVPDGVAHSVATKTFDNMPYKDVPVNLIMGSEFDRYWVLPSEATIVDGYDGHKAIHVDATDLTSGTIDVQRPIYNADVQLIKPGEWYTISFDAKGTRSIRTHIFPSVVDTSAGSYVDGVFHESATADGMSDWTLTDEYVRHSWSFKAKTPLSPTTNEGRMMFRSLAGASTYTSLPKLEQGISATPWSPNPADPEYYSDTITVHNGGTYPVEPVITATMHADNGMVGIVNDRPGILQFGTQEIDGYTTDVSEKGLNGDFSAPISGTIYNQSATNNPNWGGDSSKPNKQTGSINYASDSYNGPHMEPAYASTGTYWNGPAAKIPIAATSQNTRNNNFTVSMMLHFETTVSELGRMELTLEAGGKVQYQMVITDNNAVKDEIQVNCYVKDQQVGTMSLDRSKFTNDKLMQARLSKFGSSINFEVSPWNGKSGREMTVSLPPLTRPDMISENVEAFSVWFERNNTWGQAGMKLIAVQFDWQHVNWWTDIKNRFSNGDVLTIDVANAKTYLNGSENRTLHTIGNQWEQFELPPGDTEIAITPSSWAQPFACEVEIREAWL
ncbi:distal tail protein Dit [Lacticaseibacillus paracasei]|uniref:distal tail protein Dit n=1 Tax=Lacticaseibacillus paracasei TaxID=1597 RepID=UPI001CBCB9C7|nr:distal tail protein Dit [Lacticaseibacillus paracasei]MBZ3796252.1 phage tail family protein [Lacticaseibacillus paracasei]